MSVDSSVPAADGEAPVDTVAADTEVAAEDVGAGGVRVGRLSALWLLIAGIAGLAASFTLTVEKIELLIDPSYVPSCSLNPVLSCGSVMVTPQASLFGFPNPLLGIVAFPVVIVAGVLALAKVRLPQWFWVGLTIGCWLGTVFVHWLIFQSLYRIGALCPYCMVVWAVMIPLTVVVTAIALRPLAGNRFLDVLYQWRWSIVIFWFTAVILMILVRFWAYWSTLL